MLFPQLVTLSWCQFMHFISSSTRMFSTPCAQCRIIALREAKTGYPWSFHVETRTEAIKHMLMSTIKPVPDDGAAE